MSETQAVVIKNRPINQVKHLIKTGIDRADDYSKIAAHQKAANELDEIEYLLDVYRKMIEQRAKEDEVITNV